MVYGEYSVEEGKVYEIINKYLICNWCRTDSIDLPREVREPEITAKDQGGVNRGYRSDDVRIAWNLAGWRETTFWYRLETQESPKFKQIPLLRSRKSVFSIYNNIFFP